jgi:hypothetical protein
MHTKVAGARDELDCPTPLWDVFLDTTFQGDGETIAAVQHLVGVALVGELKLNILPLL